MLISISKIVLNSKHDVYDIAPDLENKHFLLFSHSATRMWRHVVNLFILMSKWYGWQTGLLILSQVRTNEKPVFMTFIQCILAFECANEFLILLLVRFLSCELFSITSIETTLESKFLNRNNLDFVEIISSSLNELFSAIETEVESIIKYKIFTFHRMQST